MIVLKNCDNSCDDKLCDKNATVLDGYHDEFGATESCDIFVT